MLLGIVLGIVTHESADKERGTLPSFPVLPVCLVSGACVFIHLAMCTSPVASPLLCEANPVSLIIVGAIVIFMAVGLASLTQSSMILLNFYAKVHCRLSFKLK